MAWLLAGLISMASTAVIFFPAAWVAALAEQQTAGRLTLGDAQGTLWRGSAFIGVVPDGSDPVIPLLPGRFFWRISPLALLGRVDVELENSLALTQSVSVSGDWRQWQISPAALEIPAARLAALGAPLNTLQPSGQMQLSWGVLQLSMQNGQVEMAGSMKLSLDNMASRLSPIKPLGAYNLTLNWHGQQATATLATVRGPLLLSGSGTVVGGSLQFSGKAESETGQEERLANLLYLLGQRRTDGGRDVIALEFK